MSEELVKSWEPLGKAILAYFKGDKDAVIAVTSDIAEPENQRVEIFFREPVDFPPHEQTAIMNCNGRILDIGAGSGCHALALQEMGKDVTAIDIMSQAVEVMKRRGVKKTWCGDLYDYHEQHPDEKFDCLLMMMNGIGVVGTIIRLEYFLQYARKLVTPDGVILMDSVDLREKLFPMEIAARNADGRRDYFGEVEYRMSYKGKAGAPYWWLYIDPDRLAEIADKNGWCVEAVYPSDEGQYLASLGQIL